VSLNEDLRDATLSHALGLQRLTNEEVRKILRLLDAVDRDLLRQLRKRLEVQQVLGFDRGPVTTLRLQAIRAENRALARELQNKVGRVLRKDLEAISAYESSFTVDLLKRYTGGLGISWTRPDAGLLRAIVTEKPFQGALLSKWFSGLTTQKGRAVERAISLGIAQGETVPQIMKRVRDRLDVSRRDAEAVVRTAVGHVTQGARQTTYVENSDVVPAWVWGSTFDSRTTDICIRRDGLEYSHKNEPVGHDVPALGGPGKAHWRCRSQRIPRVASWQELGLEGLTDEQKAYLNGKPSTKLTYEQFLKKQTAAFQDDALGPERARLFREGKLPLAGLYSKDGRFLTLDALRRSDSSLVRPPKPPRPKTPSRPPLPTNARELLRRSDLLIADLGHVERTINAERIEHMYAFDSSGGLISSMTGDRRQVRIPMSVSRQLADGVLTHNHPSGGSFSDADIRFATSWNLREMRAVGRNYLGEVNAYSMSGDWLVPGGGDVQAALVRLQNEFARSVRKWRAILGPLVSSGKISPEEANFRIGHEIWQEVAKSLGLRYARQKLSA